MDQIGDLVLKEQKNLIVGKKDPIELGNVSSLSCVINYDAYYN